MKLLLAALPLGLLSLTQPAVPRPPLAQLTPRASAPAPDSTTVRLLFGAESADLTELMSQVLHVEKQRLVLHDRRLAGRRLHLTLQEYRRGVPGPEQEFAPADLTQLDSAGRLQLTVYAHQVSETKVENTFVLPRATVPKTFAVVPGHIGDYSLRFDIQALRRSPDQTGASPKSFAKEFRLPIGGPATVLGVYTLPYEHEGMYLYCGLAQSHVPVTEWYKRFKVPHYVVYRVRIA